MKAATFRSRSTSRRFSRREAIRRLCEPRIRLPTVTSRAGNSTGSRNRAASSTRALPGIWQTVWLEAAGDSYLEKVRITPAIDGTVTFDACIARPEPGLTFHAIVANGEAEG